MPNFKKKEDESRPINDIALDIGEVHFIEKDAKDEKSKLRTEFFLGTTLEAEASDLARRTATVPDSLRTEAEARAYAEQYNSGWRIIEATDNDGWVFTLEEDPQFKPYHVVVEVEDLEDSKGNPHPGYVVSKTIVSGTLMLDEERLKVEDPILYEEVTTFAYPGMGVLLAELDVDPNEIDHLLEEAGIPIVPKSSDELTDEQNEAIKPYLFEGEKGLRLNVNYAKEEELGEASG